ncbi:MAG: hypothetical protein RL148_3256 [Planctomycetota bacterium]|jgi:hypothetical protein
MRHCLALLLGPLLLAQEPAAPPDHGSVEAARRGSDRAIAWLLARQRPDGAFGSGVRGSLWEPDFAVETFYAFQVAAHSLATMALLAAPETPERTVALEKAVRWLCTARVPQRGSDWDVDGVWAWVFGTVATAEVARSPRFASEEWRGLVARRGREFVAKLEQNQVPEGGFGYYDDPTFSRRPKWATSFTTSAVVPALAVALELGWTQDAAFVERAVEYVRRCRLPNGAFSYDLTPIPRLTGGEHINDVKGSLGRIQSGHWALRLAGDESVTDERLRWGLDQFFEHHEFLLVARRRPVPHEAFYANAAYFYYFGHHYAARCIELLPASERAPLHQRLRPHVLDTQRKDGSFSDFLDSSYMEVASTAFAVLALELGLR